MREIERYAKAGLIKEYSANDFVKDHSIFNSNIETRTLGQLVINYQGIQAMQNSSDQIDALYSTFNSFREICELKSRIFTVIHNEKENDQYVPIIREKYKPSVRFKNFTPTDTISVVMKKFPVLSVDIPFDKFLEFKQDPDTKLKLSRLKNWISEISSSSMTTKEVEQKIEHLLIEYSSHLDFHKMKYSRGIIETIVTTTLEVLESIITLKLSNASKVIFDLSKKK